MKQDIPATSIELSEVNQTIHAVLSMRYNYVYCTGVCAPPIWQYVSPLLDCVHHLLIAHARENRIARTRASLGGRGLIRIRVKGHTLRAGAGSCRQGARKEAYTPQAEAGRNGAEVARKLEVWCAMALPTGGENSQ